MPPAGLAYPAAVTDLTAASAASRYMSLSESGLAEARERISRLHAQEITEASLRMGEREREREMSLQQRNVPHLIHSSASP